MKHKNHYHIIYGHHACLAILKNSKREVFEIILQKDKEDYFKKEIAKSLHKFIKTLSKNEISNITNTEDKHQGIAVKCSPYLFYDEAKLLKELQQDGNNTVILDQVQDPHNIGAILRSLYCFGIKNVVMQEKNSPDITSAIARSSAGYSEMMNIYKVTNLSETIKKIKNLDYWVLGLDSNTEESEIKSVLSKFQKRVFVFGAEGFGIREMVKKNCDLLLKIPMLNDANSLNVSNAIAIIAYEVFISKV